MESIIDKKYRAKAPKRLFHYTSLSSLALILENKTLRLNSLANLDDLQERKTQDMKGISRYVFVSCWTDNKEESIPMWNMYAGLDSGVRIEMDIDPFARYTYPIGELAEAVSIPVKNIAAENDSFSCFLPIQDMRRWTSPAFFDGSEILKKIEYTSEKTKLEPQLISHNNGQLLVETGLLGIYKNTHWAFQQEWRYVLTFLPFDSFGSPDTAVSRLKQALEDADNPDVPVIQDYYDLRLKDAAIKNMRFILSPKISPGNRILAESLLHKYGLLDCLEESSLTGLL